MQTFNNERREMDVEKPVLKDENPRFTFSRKKFRESLSLSFSFFFYNLEISQLIKEAEFTSYFLFFTFSNILISKRLQFLSKILSFL